MNIKRRILHLTVILIIATIYIIPVGIGLNKINLSTYDIFYKLRIIFIIIAISLLFFDNRKQKLTYLSIMAIIFIYVTKYLLYSEHDYGLFYIIASLVVFDSLLYTNINKNLIRRVFNISYYFYLLQIIIFSFSFFQKYGFFRTIASYNDANYTAYFGLCLAYYFYTNKHRFKSYLLLVILLFTFSRLYIVSLLLFIVLTMIFTRKMKLKLQYSMSFYVLIQLMVLVIGSYYISLYETIQPEYVYLQGFERLQGMFDESNYIRFKANSLAVESISIQSSFLGVEQGTFAGLSFFSNKSIFPHNLLWSIYIQYGLLVSLLFISKYIKIFRSFENKHFPYYIVLLMYHSFLGLSSFYGFDLLLQLLIIKSTSLDNRSVQNV